MLGPAQKGRRLNINTIPSLSRMWLPVLPALVHSHFSAVLISHNTCHLLSDFSDTF